MNDKPTRGPWRATKAGASVKAESGEVAYMARRQTGEKERAANANLIAAACNAAQEINPHDPIRAAGKMVEAIESLKRIANWEFDIMGDCVAEARELARRAFLDATDRG